MSKKPIRYPPFRWIGSKYNMAKIILPILNSWPHTTYVEPFGGTAIILLRKQRSPVEVYNDIDNNLYNFFVVISNPATFKEFYNRVSLLPYSRALYNECRQTYQSESDNVERAVKWFVVARQSFAGHFGESWGLSVNSSAKNMSKMTSSWISSIEQLPAIHKRLQTVQIENNDWHRIFEIYDTPQTLFYVDPPYIIYTRTHSKYCHEMSDNEHTKLVNTLLNIGGAAVVSCYFCDIYSPLAQNGWLRIDKTQSCWASKKKTRPKRIETLLVHPKIACMYQKDTHKTNL